MLAKPKKKRLGSQLLNILAKSIVSAHGETGKVAIVVLSTANVFYERCGFSSIESLSSHSNAISVRHRYPPLSDCIRDFPMCTLPVQLRDTTAMLRFPQGEQVSSCLDKSGLPSLLGAFLFVQVTKEVKKVLMVDEILKKHLQDPIYKTNEVYILGLVTEDLNAQRDSLDVLLCIDYDKVKDGLRELKFFLSHPWSDQVRSMYLSLTLTLTLTLTLLNPKG